MASIDFDALGDIQKSLERVEAGRAIMPGVPVLARLDGRGFHTFVKGLKRPYDERLSTSMKNTAKYLLDKGCADVVYTQSDEITLAWANRDDTETKVFFGGKFQKLCSVLASMASVHFNTEVASRLGPDYAAKMPLFDCRVWQVPNLAVAASNFIWREMDATKNSISMAASTYFSPKELHGKSSKERIELLTEKGIRWVDYPDFFRKGSYHTRAKTTRHLTEDELAMIKPEYRPVGPIERTTISELAIPRATSIANIVEVLFEGATFRIHENTVTEKV